MKALTIENLLEMRKLWDAEKEPPPSGYYEIPFEFYRCPRTKKRRIINKWKKRIFNWRVPQWYKDKNKVKL